MRTVNGKEYTYTSDELVLDDDEKGDTKITSQGILLGGQPIVSSRLLSRCTRRHTDDSLPAHDSFRTRVQGTFVLLSVQTGSGKGLQCVLSLDRVLGDVGRSGLTALIISPCLTSPID